MIAVCLLGAGVVTADDDAAYTAKQLQTLLSTHCADCHNADYAESGFRVDELALEEASLASLVKVHDRLKSGEMPPADADPPSDTARAAAIDLLSRELLAIDEARQLREGRTRRRRMTRGEYEHAVHDLLKIDTPIKAILPGDAVAHGFDKTADALGLSSVLMQQYLTAARTAVESAVELGQRPQTVTTRYDLLTEAAEDPKSGLNNDVMFAKLDDAIAMFSSNYCPSELRRMKTPHAGTYKITVDAYSYRHDGADENITYRIYGGQLMRKDGDKRLLGFYEATPKTTAQPRTITVDLPKDAIIKFVPWDTGYRIYNEKAANTTETGLAVRSVTVTGPILDQWPPASQEVLFGDLPVRVTNAAEMERNKWIKPKREVVSSDPKGDARRLLTRFATRAFRRPAGVIDARPFVQLVHDRLDGGDSLTDALPLGYQAILCDPMFLTVGCDAGKVSLSPHALASRMSLFLWGSTPDDELLALAASGRIAEPAVRREQVRRMLDDPRSERFIADFANQWLDLAWIDASTPDPELFPEYDELLRESMVEETLRTLRYVFEENRPVRETVDADYAILDARMAKHYGLEDLPLEGLGFQKVQLPEGSVRGGFLTQAAIAKVTANGTHTSPVYRGSWVLDAILGMPVPPPPPNIPAVEPDVRGAKTIRELLAKHREDTACAVCHDKMDPAGFAMEELDVIGRQRAVYRVPKDAGGKIVRDQIGQRKIRAYENPDNPIDSSGTLPTGEAFDNLRSFKQKIAADERQLARAMAEKLLVYGSGEGITFCDRPAIEEIVDRADATRFGMRTLLEEVIASPTFARR